MESIIDYIGYQGPLINSFLVLFSLLGKPPYLFMFILGSIFNYEMNNQLKTMIKEPRPNNPLPYIGDDLIKGRQLYGMPSGHAQIIGFTLGFLILTKRPMQLILFSSFIGMLTIIQRWKYRKHTMEQLVAGLFVGSFFSYFIFWITESYLQRKVNI
jgi:membrane-associated phospholipid phosphatase